MNEKFDQYLSSNINLQAIIKEPKSEHLNIFIKHVT